MKKKICIVEDDTDLREAMSLMIQFTDNYELVEAFENGEAALKKIPHLETDVVLMDINLPGYDGIKCVAKLKVLKPKLLFLMCTSHEDENKIFESLKAGASGYILKTEGPIKIISALDDLFDGGSPMSSSIARKVVASFSSLKTLSPEIEELTSREKEILNLLSKGQMNKEIACALDISVGTVRKHNQNIYEKLHVNTRVEAINLYLKR